VTRTSKDGFVQAWRLTGADGKPLRVAGAHRPPTGGASSGPLPWIDAEEGDMS
jgi:hypothetical protein